jgi:formylglycine-generating enzyme required for sulfatase activity
MKIIPWAAASAAVVLAAGAAIALFPSVETPQIVERDGMMWIPSGDFLMGSDHRLAQDNERPAHRVKVDGFWMDRYHVTNAEFRKFVEATGYVTTAERKPAWETLRVQLPRGTPKPPT